MSKVVSTQTRNPRASLAESKLDKENFSYLHVQADFKTKLEDALDVESPTRPGEQMYEVVADGRKGGAERFEERVLAGAKNNVLLKARKEDVAFILEENAKEARGAEKAVTTTHVTTPDGKQHKVEETYKGPLSAD